MTENSNQGGGGGSCINLIPFFDICSVLADLSSGFFGYRYVLLYLGHCVVATVAVCGLGSWALDQVWCFTELN